MEPGLSEEEAAGRRRRMRIILVVAFALVVPRSAFGWYADRRADDRAAVLATRLRASVDEIDDLEAFVLDEQVSWGVGELDGPLRALAGEEGELAGAGIDQGELRARFRTGWGGTDRCVRLLIRSEVGRTEVGRPGGC